MQHGCEMANLNSLDGLLSMRRVLVVEDDMDHFRLIEMVLNMIKITDVVHAKDGVEALKYIEEATSIFSLIISDLNMPNMTGLEFLEKVRQDNRHCVVPFIMVTAENSLSSAISAKDKGATSFVGKPFVVDNLAGKIRTALSMDF